MYVLAITDKMGMLHSALDIFAFASRNLGGIGTPRYCVVLLKLWIVLSDVDWCYIRRSYIMCLLRH